MAEKQIVCCTDFSENAEAAFITAPGQAFGYSRVSAGDKSHVDRYGMDAARSAQEKSYSQAGGADAARIR